MAAADEPSSISDSDEVLELGAACDLDDATSRIFFSDGDSGASFSWPAAERIASALTTQASLRAVWDKYGVPVQFRPANHLGMACATPPLGSNTMCVYAAALDAGLRFPLHDFYARVLRHFGLAPSQLKPNAWGYLAAFVLRCNEAGVEPLVSAFRYLFKICAHKEGGAPAGWYHFQPYTERGRRLFTGSLQSRSGWKSRFFFVEAPSGMPWKCPVKWGKPRKDATRKVELTETAVGKLELMGSVDVRSYLDTHEMPVGDQAPLHPAMKAEAGAVAAGSKRKQPPASGLPMSAPPFRAFSAGGSGQPVVQQQSFTMSTPGMARLSSGESVPPQQQQQNSTTRLPPQGPGFPHRMFTRDALHLSEAIAKTQAANAKLSEELHLVRSWNVQYQNQLAAAQAMHAAEKAQHQNQLAMHAAERTQLIGLWHAASGDVAQLKAAIAQLKEEHAAENAQLKKELQAENAQLREELMAQATQLREEGYASGWTDRDNELFQDYNSMGCSPLVTADDH